MLMSHSGLLAMIATLFIWSSFFLTLQYGGSASGGLFDLALVRFGVAALVLIPLLIKSRAKFKTVKPVYLFIMFIGAGLPYFLLAGNAIRISSVAEGSILILGAIPLFVTSIAVLFFKEKVTLEKAVGIGLILLGVGFMLIQSLNTANVDKFQAYLLLLFCSLLWSMYTVAMRVSGLTPLEGAAFFSLSSVIAVIGVMAAHGQPSQIASWDISYLVIQFLVQGIAIGFFAAICYGHAIQQLGAELSAAIGSLTPVLASLLAWMLLSEQLNLTTAFGMAFICSGVVLASQVLNSIFYSQSNSLESNP